MKHIQTFESFLNEGVNNIEAEFKNAMKRHKFDPGLEKEMFLTKDGHGNEVRILKYEDGELIGLVYESRFGPMGTYEWSYCAWDKNGRNTGGYAMMADIRKPIAQDAIKHFMRTYESFSFRESEKMEESVLIGPESKKFIDDLQKFRGSIHQLPWMWLYQFCQHIDGNPSYFNDVVEELGCKFTDIAITGERLQDWNAIKKGISIDDFEESAKKSGINYVIGGYNVNDCILWNAKQ